MNLSFCWSAVLHSFLQQQLDLYFLVILNLILLFSLDDDGAFLWDLLELPDYHHQIDTYGLLICSHNRDLI